VSLLTSSDSVMLLGNFYGVELRQDEVVEKAQALCSIWPVVSDHFVGMQ